MTRTSAPQPTAAPSGGEEQVLLICTVGGSPEPIMAAIKHWHPDRVVFLPSPQTQGDVPEKIIPALRRDGLVLPEGSYKTPRVPDAQDFAACFRCFRELGTEVNEWVQRSASHTVVVDLTGGTKLMSAALFAQARRWPCRISYVGGTEREKGGVGVVSSGAEKVFRFENPWDALGAQAVEEATLFFNRYAWTAAISVLEEARAKATDGAPRRELTAILILTQAHEAWDRFDHPKALNLLKGTLAFENDLRALFGDAAAEALLDTVARNITHLEPLAGARIASRAFVLDLIANAKRRADAGQFDDAVSRLYRATEALAQTRLREKHGIKNTGKVEITKLPDDLREKWRTRARDGLLKLGLQDDYDLLFRLDDDLGKTFADLGWNRPGESPLEARNNSILAHGFDPISEKGYRGLFDGLLRLAGATAADLPGFPNLPVRLRPDT